jgi:hypothetical protein
MKSLINLNRLIVQPLKRGHEILSQNGAPFEKQLSSAAGPWQKLNI